MLDQTIIKLIKQFKNQLSTLCNKIQIGGKTFSYIFIWKSQRFMLMTIKGDQIYIYSQNWSKMFGIIKHNAKMIYRENLQVCCPILEAKSTKKVNEKKRKIFETETHNPERDAALALIAGGVGAKNSLSVQLVSPQCFNMFFQLHKLSTHFFSR